MATRGSQTLREVSVDGGGILELLDRGRELLDVVCGCAPSYGVLHLGFVVVGHLALKGNWRFVAFFLYSFVLFFLYRSGASTSIFVSSLHVDATL